MLWKTVPYVLVLLLIVERGVALREGFWTYQVVKEYYHDPQAFTQGLIYEEGDILYEGTGLYGKTSLRKVELATGKVLRQYDESNQSIFGEGIVALGNDLYQLTWQNGLIFLFSKEDFKLQKSFKSPREGWGLTYDGTNLILSDGSSTLYFLKPSDLTVERTISVTNNGKPLSKLNELEYIKGEIWANVWLTNFIAKIDPKTGNVIAMIDFTGIISGRGIDVLNGIAYDETKNRIFVTGKLWPKLFEVKVFPPSTSSTAPSTTTTDSNPNTNPLVSEAVSSLALPGIVLVVSLVLFSFYLR